MATMQLRFTFFLMLLFPFMVHAQDSIQIKVHFIYGSRPVRAFKATEMKRRGGMWGGHVGIEYAPNSIIDFAPEGKFHWWAIKKQPHSRFSLHTTAGFYEIYGGTVDSEKRMELSIPITSAEYAHLGRIVEAYCSRTPYDYAFVGMRCAAASYDILAQTGVLRQCSRGKTIFKAFYPRKFRKLLLQKAGDAVWSVKCFSGTERRKWERE